MEHWRLRRRLLLLLVAEEEGVGGAEVEEEGGEVEEDEASVAVNGWYGSHGRLRGGWRVKRSRQDSAKGGR